jgi:hypothetical protein
MTLNGLRKTLILVAVCEFAIGMGRVASSKSSTEGASGTHPAPPASVPTGVGATVPTTLTTTLPATRPAGLPATTTTAYTARSTTMSPPTVLSLHGSGSMTSGNFTVTRSQWTISYKFDCVAFGNGTGNFAIFLTGVNGTHASDPEPVNEQGRAGRQGSAVIHGAGTYYLAVNSQCNWLLTVVD